MIKSIIISGPPAVGKTTVALGISKQFSIPYMGGGDILKELAIRAGFTPSGNDWWDTDDGIKFLKLRSLNTDFDKKVDDQLIKLFYKGNIVLTSYTLPWLVDGGVKIWLDGSHENSAQRMQTRDNISNKDAMIVTKKRYDENKILYKKLYNFDFGSDPNVFDIILNTDNLNAKQVLDHAIKQARELI